MESHGGARSHQAPAILLCLVVFMLTLAALACAPRGVHCIRGGEGRSAALASPRFLGAVIPPVLALAAFVLLVLAASARADTAFTFSYTGGEQTLAIPAGVTSVHVTAIGGKGAPESVGSPLVLGGYGAVVSATVAVQPSSTLYVEVGGNGQFTDGGFNGGGSIAGQGGGGGGGATDVQTCSISAASCPSGGSAFASRLLIAAGGGGVGYNGYSVTTAGAGATQAHQAGTEAATAVKAEAEVSSSGEALAGRAHPIRSMDRARQGRSVPGKLDRGRRVGVGTGRRRRRRAVRRWRRRRRRLFGRRWWWRRRLEPRATGRDVSDRFDRRADGQSQCPHAQRAADRVDHRPAQRRDLQHGTAGRSELRVRGWSRCVPAVLSRQSGRRQRRLHRDLGARHAQHHRHRNRQRWGVRVDDAHVHGRRSADPKRDGGVLVANRRRVFNDNDAVSDNYDDRRIAGAWQIDRKAVGKEAGLETDCRIA